MGDAAEQPQPTVVIGERPDANPFADDDAPYKVDRSANGKLTDPLIDTPRTVVVIPKEVQQDIGATSLRDVARSTAGVTIGTGEGGNAFGDRIFIRGFDARNDMYIDGLRDPGVGNRELFALEQIEIIKGPASAFGGRGTTGGSVNLITKAPARRDFTVIEGGVGNADYARVTADVNRHVTERLAVRVNALFHNAQAPRRDWVWSRRWGVAGAAKWDFADNWALKLDYYHFRMHGRPDFGHPFNAQTRKPWKVREANFYGVAGRDFLRNKADIGTLALEYSPSSTITLSSATRLGATHNRYIASSPRSPCSRALTPRLTCPTTGPVLPLDQWALTIGSPQRHQRNSYLSNLTDARIDFSTGAIEHRLVAGFEYADEHVSAMRYTSPLTVEDSQGNIIATPVTFVRNLVRPDARLGFKIPVVLDTTPRTLTKVRNWGLFAVDTIEVTPKVRFVLGGRYDSFKVTLSRRAGLATNGSPVTPIALRNTDHFFNGQASLLYKPKENFTLYGSWATSSNPSGEQLDGGSSASYGGLAPSTENLKPERNHALEAGTKWEVFDRNLILTAALFQTKKNNAREQTEPNVYETVGKLRARGVELGVAGKATRALSLFGGYTYLDAKIVKSKIPGAKGRRFANVPRHSFTMLATYDVTKRLNLGGQAYYQSRIYGGGVAAGNAYIPGYWRFDAVGRYEISKRFEVRVNAVNLFNKRYYDAIYTSAAPFSYIAPGRLVKATLAVRM